MTLIPRNKYLFLTVILAILLGSDQASKLYIEQHVPLYHSIEIWKNFFHITHVRNTGVAFGILATPDNSFLPFLFILVSLLAVGVISYLYAVTALERIGYRLALAMILGGGIGNLIDRIRLGEVIDFLDVHWYEYHWPAFNVADSCITVGVGLLIIFGLRGLETIEPGA